MSYVNTVVCLRQQNAVYMRSVVLKRAENRPRNFMETALAACDVSTICNLADYLQVHSAVGMDHGISGGKTGNVRTSDLGENLGWI